MLPREQRNLSSPHVVITIIVKIQEHLRRIKLTNIKLIHFVKHTIGKKQAYTRSKVQD